MAARSLLVAAAVMYVTAGAAFADTVLDKNKTLAKEYFSSVIEKEDASKLGELFDRDAVIKFGPSWESPVSKSHQIKGLAQIREHIAHTHESRDISSTIIDIVAEGDTVAIYRMTKEKFKDGRTAEVPWMSFFKFKNGKIVSIDHLHDSLHQLNEHKKSIMSSEKK